MPSSKKKLFIHGHFYQPPRLNPFTNVFEQTPFEINNNYGSFRDWNHAILAECYKPNADLGNFEHISYNLFRSLAEWLEVNDKETYDKIIEADRKNYRDSGFGNALAYPYDHSIIPLVNEDDKEIEIYWGIHDFFMRYGHMPVGLWLPEAGIDEKTMVVMEKNGIRFTILSVWQAKTANGPVDPSRLYRCELPHKKTLDVIFDDRQLSGDLSFNSSEMGSADNYVSNYLKTNLTKDINIAALDGERFGHHLKGGEYFLKRLIEILSNNDFLEMGNIVEQYYKFDKTIPVEIYDYSSWSCHHGGLRRWSGDCDCSYDEYHGQRTNGYWKSLLLGAFRVLSSTIDTYFYDFCRPFVSNELELKKEYIYVMQSKKSFDDYLQKFLIRPINGETKNKLRVLLDMQKYKLAMFTSDAFFFADLDRIEPRINIANAKKAISMFREIDDLNFMKEIEGQFLDQLSQIYSNFSNKNGKDLYYEDGIKL